MNHPSHPRIWVALDAIEQSEAPLGAALALARLLHAELNALFVENDDLFRLAAFPRSFERRLFGSPSLAEPGTVGASPTHELEQRLRTQAMVLQRQLDRAASATGVRWRFQTARGRIVQQALERAAGADCVVVPAMAVATALAVSRRPTPPPMHRRASDLSLPFQREVWAVPGGGPRARQVLELAHRLLAGRARGRLLLPEQPETAAALRHWLREQGWQDDWRESSLAELREARQAPTGVQAGILLMPRPEDAAERELLESLWRRAGWPVILA